MGSAGVQMTRAPAILANHFKLLEVTVLDAGKAFTIVNVKILTQNPADAQSVKMNAKSAGCRTILVSADRRRKMNKICISYCPQFGECGMDYDEDDLDEDGCPLECPSSNDGGYCMDRGEDEGCDEFYPGNE